MTKYNYRFYRLEYIFPAFYLTTASLIFLYQTLVPDNSPPSMIGIDFRASDFLLVILSIPSYIGYPFLTPFSDINTLNNDNPLMLWTKRGNAYFSLTYLFIVTPFCYFLWGLLIRKCLELYRNTRNMKKSR